jgi:uncharacterized protein YjbI with pentapeptide repeats
MAGVNLRVATLKNANLQNCDLRAAVLAGADLEVYSSFLSHAIVYPLFDSSSLPPVPKLLYFVKSYGFRYYHIGLPANLLFLFQAVDEVTHSSCNLSDLNLCTFIQLLSISQNFLFCFRIVTSLAVICMKPIYEGQISKMQHLN